MFVLFKQHNSSKYDNPVHPENQVIHCVGLMLPFTGGCYLWLLLSLSHSFWSCSSVRVWSMATACSVVTMYLTTFSTWLLPVTGNRCLDRKSSAIYLFKNELKVNISHFHAHFSMWGGSLMIALLNSGSTGLWAVIILNLTWGFRICS